MLTKCKVLVTGANGFLGANTVVRLIKNGYSVRAMVRKGRNRTSLKNLDCEIFEGEIINIFDIEKAVKDCEYIVHCAANTSQSLVKWNTYKRANIDSTALLIEVCKKNPISKFVFVSTSNCFTNGTKENPGTENSGFMPWLRKSGYAKSKFIAQRIVLNEVKTSNFPAVVVAPTFMIGSRDMRPSSGKLLLYGLQNRIVFYPPGGKNFVDVELVAEAICNSLTHGKVGECYLLSGHNLSYREFFAELKKFSGKRQIFIPVPLWVLCLISYLSDIFSGITGLSLPLNRVNRKLLCLDNYFGNNKAIQELNLKTTDIRQAIEKAFRWFKENEYLK